MAINRSDYELIIDVDVWQAKRLIRDIKDRASSYKRVFEIARLNLEALNATHFATSGKAPTGKAVYGDGAGGSIGKAGPWAPYGSWSSKAGKPVTMVRSGALMESLTNLRGAPNDIGRSSATFGTNVEYALYHQYGTSKMPKRPVVFEPTGFAEELGQITGFYLTGDASVVGLRKLFGS
jgi:phage gpG-like protein